MTLYRIICAFEPLHPRLAGTRTDSTARRGQSPRYRRGAWRVVDCYLALSVSHGEHFPGPDPIFAAAGELYTLASRRLAPGTLCNPHRLLNAVIKDRRHASH